jgi:hypothetical protein
MQEIIRPTFRSLVEFLPSELSLMPLSRWNESVLRYFFCRFLSESFPKVKQFVECGKIDLVLEHAEERAFVEFKFYRHPIRHDPYDGSVKGYKGGPGPQNLSEFQSCVDQLDSRPHVSGLSKYIILLFADPVDRIKRKNRFDDDYSRYRHPLDNVTLNQIDSIQQADAAEGIISAHLYEILAVKTQT